MDTINQIQERIDGWHKVLNHNDSIPSKAYRRNAVVYELVCYVNNIIACYIGGNFEPISVFIERSRVYIENNAVKDIGYYNKVENYFNDMESFLSHKASVTKI